MNKDNEEILNPDFDINAKYEDMIKKAKHNVDLYLETGKNYTDISLSYDVKNYLPKALKEIERLNKFVDDILNFYKHSRYGEELTKDNMFKFVLNRNEMILAIEEFNGDDNE